jgi:hypothetical protein
MRSVATRKVVNGHLRAAPSFFPPVAFSDTVPILRGKLVRPAHEYPARSIGLCFDAVC